MWLLLKINILSLILSLYSLFYSSLMVDLNRSFGRIRETENTFVFFILLIIESIQRVHIYK